MVLSSCCFVKKNEVQILTSFLKVIIFALICIVIAGNVHWEIWKTQKE